MKAARGAEPTRLRGLTWEHDRGYGSIASATSEYLRARPDLEISWDARSLQSFGDQPLAELVAGYDLLVIDHPHVPEAAEEGLLAPLDDKTTGLRAEEFVGRSHHSYRWRGTQYALAIDAAAQVALYRPDLLSEPPRTWAQVLDLAREGQVLWPAKTVDAYASLFSLCSAYEGRDAAQGSVFCSREAFQEAWHTLSTLARLVPSECRDANPIAVAEMLADSDRWSYSPLAYGYITYSREGYRRRRLAHADIATVEPGPPRGSTLGGAGLAVSAGSPHRVEATAFAAWVGSAEAQRGSYLAGGGQPGHVAAWEDQRIAKETLDFFGSTRATLEHASLRPQHPQYMSVQNGVAPAVRESLLRQEGRDELYAQINHLLARMEPANADRRPAL